MRVADKQVVILKQSRETLELRGAEKLENSNMRTQMAREPSYFIVEYFVHKQCPGQKWDNYF